MTTTQQPEPDDEPDEMREFSRRLFGAERRPRRYFGDLPRAEQAGSSDDEREFARRLFHRSDEKETD